MSGGNSDEGKVQRAEACVPYEKKGKAAEV